MQHTSDKQPATRSQIVLTTNKTVFSPCLCPASRLLFRWGGLACSTVCVTPRCYGNVLFSQISTPPSAVHLHPLAGDPLALCGSVCALSFFFFTLAAALMWFRSVLGCPAPCWPTPWGRGWRTRLGAIGYNSWQGTVQLTLRLFSKLIQILKNNISLEGFKMFTPYIYFYFTFSLIHLVFPCLLLLGFSYKKVLHTQL